MKKIAVFTPTYNRLELIKRLYSSLNTQTTYDFEWIVIDDGSTDNTEDWFYSVIGQSNFTIKYRVQSHGGKHRAINYGVKIADSEFIFFVDSDDYLFPNSIEKVISWINKVPKQSKIAGVAGLCVDPNGNPVGDVPNIPVDSFIECSNLKRYCNHLLGDKAEIYNTELLRKYPFPEYEGEFFVTERLIWDRIAKDGYVLRWYNSPIYICEYLEDGLTNSGINMVKGHLDNFQGYIEYVKQSLQLMDPIEAVTIFREYNRVGRIMKLPVSKRARNIDFSLKDYNSFLLVKMPFYYLCRLISK